MIGLPSVFVHETSTLNPVDRNFKIESRNVSPCSSGFGAQCDPCACVVLPADIYHGQRSSMLQVTWFDTVNVEEFIEYKAHPSDPNK